MSGAISTRQQEVLDSLLVLERRRRLLEVESQALIAEAQQLDLARTVGARSLPAMLSQLCHITLAEARSRVVAAEFLAPRMTLTGERVEPLYPEAAAAQAAGEISAQHARVVIDTIEKLPDAAIAGILDDLEQTMVRHAREFDPNKLAKVGRHLHDLLDPDGVLRDSDHAEKIRDLRIRRLPNGSARIEGELSVRCAEYLIAALGAFMCPKGPDDSRTPGQRRHDALLEVVLTAMRGGTLPKTSGVTTSVMLTVSNSDLVTTGSGALVPKAEVAKWIGADTRFYASLIDKAKVPVSYSPRAARLFTETQRLVIAARDGGCTQPGCTASASEAEFHHIREYSKGGRTSVDNGAMVCPFHHRQALEQGWMCLIINGHVHWIAPTWIDPTQTPRRNRAHRPWENL